MQACFKLLVWIGAEHLLKLNIAEAFDPYRSEPRFQEILRKAGLAH